MWTVSGSARATTPRRVAMLSVHTSPLDQPGTGDAGGMNVYVAELAKQLARLDVEVEIFTRATTSELPPVVEVAPGVHVRHVMAGPYGDLSKADLAAQLCAFATGVLRAEAGRKPGWYDVVHSHYWLSGQVGWLATDRWGVPLVHSMHTMAKVKNLALAAGDVPEPRAREVGEEQVVDAAHRIVANTDDEARQLSVLYGADPDKVATVRPGVDLSVFTPGSRRAARAALGLGHDDVVLLFAGRIQPLKAPDVLVRAAARLVAEAPALRTRLVVPIVGGPSGTGMDRPGELMRLARELRVDDVVEFYPPVDQPTLAQWYRAADLTVVPSYSESFGLVALESQACGTPVVASAVGGLRTAVRDDHSGLLVDGHDPVVWSRALGSLVTDAARLRRLRAGAARHAASFGWETTAARTLEVYAEACERRRAQLFAEVMCP
ncbi:D-inositol-3-phosphate glycosyltransferase [Phytoactinopolyspora alkaliphila]|uniref:D-inositol-3-phosphate glycosyltransferase n=1 Tax=Phytoactinopolyspora alkaliphila TaxID=1783498 RepID=A0A6N9YIK8_9ACTN|nr:D-inositol-3-phosphate glycosyltransferase [Phytoactinopolyspora alkaliphila]NED94833.1 D-inositol-3-phosphate glycosyltransferase [Phytoactinopolyspora alkaliphila]